jgi:hypothetical protein
MRLDFGKAAWVSPLRLGEERTVATPDQGRKRTWRFRLNDATTLEVSSPPLATEGQIRRRGRWSLILGVAITALIVVGVAAADQLVADADALSTSTPAGNSLNANQQPGTTVEYDLSASINETGNATDDVFKSAGDTVNATITRGGAWLASPAGSPASFSFTSYDVNQAGKVRITVPCGTSAGTEQAMTAVLTAVASNGKTLSGNPVTLTWTITAQGADAASCTPANAAPTVDAGGPYNGAEGSDIVINGASANDPDGDALTYSWAKNESGIEDSGTCTLTDASTLSPTLNCNDNGTVTLTLTVDDGQGHTPSDTATVNVSNVNPTVTFDASGNGANPTSVNENADATTGKVTYSYTISDPGTNDTVDAVDTSCGVSAIKVAASDSESDTAGNFKCIFPDGDDPPAGTDTTLSAAASDDDDAAFGTADTLLVNIQNVAPTLTSLGAGNAANCGSANSLTINFSDPADTSDTYSASIDWGDGNITNAAGISTGYITTHVYASAGPHTVSVTVSDDDLGTSASMQKTLIVNYNTSGVLQPVNWTQAQNNPSIFKWGSTIPVKVEFTDCDGTPAGGLSVKIAVKKIAGSTPPSGDNEEITNTNSPDSGAYMRWVDSKYLYNLNTKSLADKTATYEITITVESTLQTVVTQVGTKEK